MVKRKSKKSVARKVNSSAKKAAPRKAKRSHDIHTGQPTGREAQAMQRLQSLTERYIAEVSRPRTHGHAPGRNCELIHVGTGAGVSASGS